MKHLSKAVDKAISRLSDGLSGTKQTKKKLKPEQVVVGDYLLLTPPNEIAKMEVTNIVKRDGVVRIIEGTVTFNGQEYKVGAFRDDFEKGYVKKISKDTTVKQKFK